MAQYFAPEQSNIGWGLTLKMAGKHPAIAERIWSTYSDALAYANDTAGTAVSGLMLTVLNDTTVNDVVYKAGAYFLKSVATKANANDAVLVPTGMSEADIVKLIEGKLPNVSDTIVSFGTPSMSENNLTFPYTTKGGTTANIEITLNNATTTQNGLMTKEQVASLNSKIEGVKINNNVLSISNGVAEGTFAFGLVNEAITLSFNEDVIGSVPVADFIKDGLLESVDLVNADGEGKEGTFLKFVFNADSEKQTIYVDVAGLIDVYALQKGTITGGTYVGLELSVEGDGSSDNAWKINATINDNALADLVGHIGDNVLGVDLTNNAEALKYRNVGGTAQTHYGTIASEIDEINSTIDGIVSTGGEANKVNDVQVNGVSVVADKVANIPLASATADGVMSKADKQKLDAMEPFSDAEIETILEEVFG